MKAWILSDDVGDDDAMAAQVTALRPLIQEVLGQSAALVEARWSLIPAADGQRRLALNLSDWTCPSGVETTFGLGEQPSMFDTRWKVHRLWGDLLQARNHQQLSALLEAGV